MDLDFGKVWIEVDWVRLGVLAAALVAPGWFLARRRPDARPGEADPFA